MGNTGCHRAGEGRTKGRVARTVLGEPGQYRVTRPREERVSGDTRSPTVLNTVKARENGAGFDM